MMMTLIVKKKDVNSSANLAEALRSQIKEFPKYLHENWDSIEASLCDYIEDINKEICVLNFFDESWLENNCPVYAEILTRLKDDYPSIRVEFH
jgi:hypothetical protein